MTLIRNIILIFFLTNIAFCVLIRDDSQLNIKNIKHRTLLNLAPHNETVEPSPGSFQISAKSSMNFPDEDPLPDKKMAEKYGLIIPPPNVKIEPAPEWLQKSMFQH